MFHPGFDVMVDATRISFSAGVTVPTDDGLLSVIMNLWTFLMVADQPRPAQVALIVHRTGHVHLCFGSWTSADGLLPCVCIPEKHDLK